MSLFKQYCLNIQTMLLKRILNNFCLNTFLTVCWRCFRPCGLFVLLTMLSIHFQNYFFSAINLTGYYSNGQSFLVQEFISNPFLIDNRKFSIGIMVGFTSAKPLKAYVLDSTMELRFCEKEYDAEDLTDPASYVADGMELYKIKFIAEVSLEPVRCNSNRLLCKLRSIC